MTTSGACCGRCVSAVAANAAIRRLVAGRAVWTPEALAELDRLRAVWRAAVARELTTAA
ncbi:hypothetical protein [Streptomyces reniochalinae]|uniref:hypothetical protein n=1 Tax=Streptomyces reniochalinae TaxID=2250578 RepID=UPI0015F07D18|nr:hypothetical protein [Streptomyces reniochalinae]